MVCLFNDFQKERSKKSKKKKEKEIKEERSETQTSQDNVDVTSPSTSFYAVSAFILIS